MLTHGVCVWLCVAVCDCGCVCGCVCVWLCVCVAVWLCVCVWLCVGVWLCVAVQLGRYGRTAWRKWRHGPGHRADWTQTWRYVKLSFVVLFYTLHPFLTRRAALMFHFRSFESAVFDPASGSITNSTVKLLSQDMTVSASAGTTWVWLLCLGLPMLVMYVGPGMYAYYRAPSHTGSCLWWWQLRYCRASGVAGAAASIGRQEIEAISSRTHHTWFPVHIIPRFVLLLGGTYLRCTANRALPR